MKRHLMLMVLFLTLFSVGLVILNYTGDAAVNRGKAVAKARLPGELKNVTIRDYFVGLPEKDIGFIQTVVGAVIVARGDMSQAYYAVRGDKLFEKDIVFTLKSSRCRFRLNGEDVVTMGENAKVGIKSFIDNRRAKTKSATFTMARGKAMYYSLRLFKYKGSTMNVETPTAVCGVRGTKFGVEVIELEGKPVASLPVVVADASETGGFRHLAQGNPPNSQTNFYCFEGLIQVTSTVTGQSTTLGSGQGVNAGGTGLGGSFTTPPGVTGGFHRDTEGSTPGGDTGGTGGTGTGNGAGTGTGTTGTIDTSSITQNQTTNTVTSTTTTTATGRYGFMATMLKYSPDGWYYQAHLMTPMLDFTSSFICGVDPFGSDASIILDGSSSHLAPTVTAVSNYNGIPLNFTPTALSHSEWGKTDYMEWGEWSMDIPMTNGTDYNFIDHKGWYINGIRTTDAQMAALKAGSGTGIYTGSAYGTYSIGYADTAVSLTGSFNAKVYFSMPQVVDFDLSLTGAGQKSVTVSGASGYFVGSTSQFVVTGGTVTITGQPQGSTPQHFSYGSVYGDTAQNIGGVWAVKGGPSLSDPMATGIFHGTKPQ